jgi:Type II secretion system (T2SS), protein E, N-terminal domain
MMRFRHGVNPFVLRPQMSTPLRERPDAPLGTLIFRAGLLPAETIESALQESSRTGKRLGEILLERKLLEETELSRLLAGQKGLPFVMLRDRGVNHEALKLFTEDQARLYRALPFQLEGGSPTVAISDPTNEVVMRNIREALDGTDVQFAVATRTELTELITELYNPNGHAMSANGNGSEAYSNGASAAPEAPVAVAEPEDASEPEEPAAAEHVSEPEPQPEPEADVRPELQAVAAQPEVAPAPEPEPEPAAEPVAITPEPVVPAPAPEPAPDPAPEPVTAPERVAPAATPEPEPAPLRLAPPPQPVQSADAQPHRAGAVTFRVAIRLSNNDRVEAAVVGDPIAAKAQAKALIRYIAGKDGTDWPYVGGRFLKPDAIVSIDLVEQQPGETA